MQIEACLVCDSASDYQGKLCVLGAFDTIGAQQAPFNYPHSSVVVRVRFERAEEGKHPFRLMLINQDGQPHGPRIEGEVNVVVSPECETASCNLILNMNNLPFPTFGSYHFDFSIDGGLKARIPVYVKPVTQIEKAA